jgi:UDPglucose 6-dehydrogenase
MKIGILGCGKLGLPVGIATSYKNHDVLGYDINPNINSNSHPKDVLLTQEADENGKNSLHNTDMLKNSKMKFADNMEDVVNHSDIIFIAIQTPHQNRFEGHIPIPEERADFDYSWLITCITELSKIMDNRTDTKIVTIISTVLPGTLRKYIFPILSKNIKLCYNPFFIAMGTVVFDFYNPEFILLGRVHQDAENKVKEFYKTITNAEVFSTSLENAEMIKVSYNTFITTKLVLANNMMEMCHKLPNTNVDEVMRALKKGTRRLISNAYLNGGMGDGGGCHPRDNIAMSWLNKELKIDYNYYDFIMKKREQQTEFLVNVVEEEYKKSNLPICVLGTAFKPETNLETGSPAILFVNLLKNHGIECETYDPHMTPNKKFNLDKKLYFIGCKHKIFKTYDFPEGSIVVDPNRYIPLQKDVNVIHIGVCPKK